MTSCTDFSPIRNRPEGPDVDRGLESQYPGALSTAQICPGEGGRGPRPVCPVYTRAGPWMRGTHVEPCSCARKGGAPIHRGPGRQHPQLRRQLSQDEPCTHTPWPGTPWSSQQPLYLTICSWYRVRRISISRCQPERSWGPHPSLRAFTATISPVPSLVGS